MAVGEGYRSMDNETTAGLTPFAYYLTVIAISSTAGVADFLRTRRKVTWRHILTTVLLASLAGLAVGGWLFEPMRQEPGKLLTVSILAGFGGGNLLSALADLFKRTIIKATGDAGGGE